VTLALLKNKPFILLFKNKMRTSRWQSFIKCFNSNKKTKEFKELSDKQLEKLEFTHLKEMYQN